MIISPSNAVLNLSEKVELENMKINNTTNNAIMEVLPKASNKVYKYKKLSPSRKNLVSGLKGRVHKKKLKIRAFEVIFPMAVEISTVDIANRLSKVKV